jgi:hypothetical protein
LNTSKALQANHPAKYFQIAQTRIYDRQTEQIGV